MKSKPSILDISVSSIAPNLKMLGWGEKLIMVLSSPTFEELPEIIPSIFPVSLEITCSAFVALTAPDGLAEGAAIGVLESLRID